ncbi:MAG: 50S ribosomal protein L18 [Spirochaetia bacterium]|nr:50S ribosomal protein L18 [Spirochaetia bacterium]
MSILKRTATKRAQRVIRHDRVRKHVIGTPERPRLSFFKGATTIYAQVIDDFSGKTLVGIGTNSKEAKSEMKGANKASAVKLGKKLADKCKEKGINTLVFDRGGYRFHGVVKAFADSVREAGIKF